jgi:hypothetical protein
MNNADLSLNTDSKNRRAAMTEAKPAHFSLDPETVFRVVSLW